MKNIFFLIEIFIEKSHIFMAGYYRSENKGNQTEINIDNFLPELLIHRGRICVIV